MHKGFQRMAGWVRSNPVITITGSTGTGKSQVSKDCLLHRLGISSSSKLAVCLAQRFNGEVVNADALQIYSGLPIATNKPNFDEMGNVPHHLLGCVDIHETPWTVTEFVTEARKAIRDIHSRGKLPIIVGGTHYYIFSLLQKNSLTPEAMFSEGPSSDAPWPKLQMDADSLLRELQRLDPVAASWWHPHDDRKIRRSLEICLKTGQKVSEIYEAQKAARQASSEGANPLEYEAFCIYLHADREQLRSRLNDRVDDMISRGLLHEIEYMRQKKMSLEQQSKVIDCSRGIWVAIGFKEFEAYFAALSAGQPMELLQAESERGRERTKISTHQYAVRQARYVRHKIFRLFQALPEEGLFQVLDTSNFQDGLGVIAADAVDLTYKFLNRQPMDIGSSVGISVSTVFESSLPSILKSNTCKVCNVTTTTVGDWERHSKTKRHLRAARKFDNGITNCA